MSKSRASETYYIHWNRDILQADDYDYMFDRLWLNEVESMLGKRLDYVTSDLC